MTRRFHFRGLCVAVVLETAYTVYEAAYGNWQSKEHDREGWYYMGAQGQTMLRIAGLA